MQSSSEGASGAGVVGGVWELAAALRREKLFINSERSLLQNLNEEVSARALELLQASWLCSQQRNNLTALITSRCEADSVQACRRASLLEETTFVDAYKVLRYKEALNLGELLGWLRDSPHLVSLCLILGEESLPNSLPAALASGLYGSGRTPPDRTRLLAVLRSLIKHQLAPSSDPRKLLRTGKCALARLYGVFRDGHTPARQFLVAALHGPVLGLLQEDDFFLDIDPDKALERFSPADRIKKFGQPNSAEYMAKVARYRKWTVQSLYNLSSRFIASLRENWSSFPSAIAWIVQQVAHVLKQHSRISERELHAIVTDLVLTHFVCPAIVNPEAHGVVEVPVSYVARFNLIQVAQIVQMLCLARYQEVEPKVRDLYMRFERESVWSLVEGLVSEEHCQDGPRASAPEGLHASLRTEPAAHTLVALFTRQDLHVLITFLKRISSKLNNNTPSLTSEEYSSTSTPRADNSPYEGGSGTGSRSNASSTSASDTGSSSVGEGYTANLAALLQTLEPNYRSRLHDLLKKQADFSTAAAHPSPSITEAKEHSENGTNKKSLLAKVPKPRLPRSASTNSALAALTAAATDEKTVAVVNGEAKQETRDSPEVLVIKLANVDEDDYVGMVPESKVLECYYGGADSADSEEPGPEPSNQAPVQKRTRFSVSHDEVSLGNTSDNLEAVSEAASNHSVTSSLELETEDQNDNLSDMVSANVSGRGSPNISGRETPSSQVTDGDGGGPDIVPVRRIALNAPAQQAVSVAQAKLLKQTRNDIEDKFCKFEIRKLVEGDETISIISDTWSTDVLASDSETIGDSCDQTQVAAGNQVATLATSVIAPDVSETASESAWSMDVLASDSDRNTEVDTDDCVSVAARSDTSWPRRPSHHEEVTSTPQRSHSHQSGSAQRAEIGSPRHTSRPHVQQNRSGGYLSATAQLSRGGELDLSAQALPQSTFSATIDNRKSILVNGYPVMTCFTSAPDSPITTTPVALPHDVFDYASSNGNEAPTESTLEPAAGGSSDATSQWVDDSFPQPQHSPSVDDQPAYNLPQAPKSFDLDADLMDHSLNSSESSFNASSSSHYDRSRFESEGPVERPETTDSRSAITDLMTRMSSATISTSANLVNNVSRIVKSEIRTSIVSISSSRIERGKSLRDTGMGGNSNMSLSTLSVNSGETSMSDRSSSQDVNSEIVTERRVSPPPQREKNVSTGAIPKSISFDATAEKSQRLRRTGAGAGMGGEEPGLANNLDDLKNNMKRSGGNLLHKIKMFRHKGRAISTPLHSSDIKLSEEEQRNDEGASKENCESSEDILAKYRRKSSSESSRTRRSSRRPSDPVPDAELDSREGVVDLSNPEVFASVKRRLRLVLSSPDMHCIEYVPSRGTSASLVEWVRAACGAAGSTSTQSGEVAAAHAEEVARALQGSGAAAARLAGALRADLAARRPYAAYLTHCRAGLTHTLHLLTRQVTWVRAECAACARSAGAARVLDQLERGNALRKLARHHHAHTNHALHLNGGELMDEKATRLTSNIKAITAEVKADPSWEGASATLLEALETTVERAAFAKLYLHVMFPNGDGDIARDQVLSEHIRRLAACVSAGAAGVAQRHLWAAPWPRAQAHLQHLGVYRTPKDKVSCVVRCVMSIMAVLGLTEEGVTPAADDLTPVLVYVIIRVNPPSLLSTIEFVNALGGPALAGEALYYWTHFCAAVTYIKTMDYPRSGAGGSSRHSST